MTKELYFPSFILPKEKLFSLSQFANIFLHWFANSGYVNCKISKKMSGKNLSWDTLNAVLTTPDFSK